MSLTNCYDIFVSWTFVVESIELFNSLLSNFFNNFVILRTKHEL